MPYYRLTSPSYFGGLPATHDAVGINNLSGPGTPAPISLPPGSGTYENTRLEVPGEVAEATRVNRANSALAENCDFIDDIIHVSRPSPKFLDATAGGAVASLTITDEVFVAKVGTPNTQVERNKLIAVVDSNTFEEFVVSGARVVVSAIEDGAAANVVGQEASGFRTNPEVFFTPSIPASADYRLVYLTRAPDASRSDPSSAGSMGDILGMVLTNLGRQSGSSMSFIPALSTWADTTQLAATLTQNAIDEVVDGLASTTGSSGIDKVGAEALTSAIVATGGLSLGAGTLTSQLQAMIDKFLRNDGTNTWTGANTWSALATFEDDAVFETDAIFTGTDVRIEPAAAGSANLSLAANGANPVIITGGSSVGLNFDIDGGSLYEWQFAGSPTMSLDATNLTLVEQTNLLLNVDSSDAFNFLRGPRSGTFAGGSSLGAARLMLQAQLGLTPSGADGNRGGMLEMKLAQATAGSTPGLHERHGGFMLTAENVNDHDGDNIGLMQRATFVLATDLDDGETVTDWYESPFADLDPGQTEVVELLLICNDSPAVDATQNGFAKAMTAVWTLDNAGATSSTIVAHGVSDTGNSAHAPQTITAGTVGATKPKIDITRTGSTGDIQVVAWIKVYRSPASP